jgi:hypothetical protein
MRISDPIRTDRLVITFDKADVKAMLNKDEDKLSEFAITIEKWDTWTDDVKKITTKEILQRARPL